jgi:hypothetical protein
VSLLSLTRIEHSPALANVLESQCPNFVAHLLPSVGISQVKVPQRVGNEALKDLQALTLHEYRLPGVDGMRSGGRRGRGRAAGARSRGRGNVASSREEDTAEAPLGLEQHSHGVDALNDADWLVLDDADDIREVEEVADGAKHEATSGDE